jgi:PAS domain S-box-containing protein
MATRDTVQKTSKYSQIFMPIAWGFVIVISSFIFLYVGYWMDNKLSTEPAFMLGLFFLAIFLSVGRLYWDVWQNRFESPITDAVSVQEGAGVAPYDDAAEQAAAEQELLQGEKILYQIMQGSTIPTFVINKDHIVTHWNKAIERLTGYSADEIVGTNRHWKAFYDGEKPIMADLIVDKVQEENIEQYYGKKGRKSRLIDGAFEAEDFFLHMGDRGRWLYFTGAPIVGADGSIIGAIETLWDTTDTKMLQDERVKHIHQLSSLWKITSALSETLDLDETLNAAVHGIIENLDVDSVVIYLKDDDSGFRVACSAGYSENLYQSGSMPGPESAVTEVVKSNEKIILEGVVADEAPYTEFLSGERLRSAAYIPLTSKGGVFGVIGISSHSSGRFTEDDKSLLAIISNRIAVAIENASLHQETKKFGQFLELKVQQKTAKLEESYQEIQLSEEKYRTMFDADPNPIIIADRETLRILDVNATALECYGYSRDEFLALSFCDLGFQKDEELVEGVKTISLNQSTFYPKRVHKKKNGESFYVNVHIRSVRFMGRDSLIATTPDVTENVEKESQLIQASKMATLGTMASGIAHEINQPLNVIQVCSDYFMKMIKKGETIDEEDFYAMAEEIERNVQRAAQTITHMKDFSRQSEVESDQLNINRPINDVFKILGQQLRIHGIDVTMDLADNLPSIVADHNRLEQVFINLVTNARDALDEKESQNGSQDWNKILKIKSCVEGDHVVVTVYDNGIGIPEEIRDKIFEPFFTTKDVGKGTGLGMSISYGIIKDYNGTIDVESDPGNGTTFTLTFPIGNRVTS